MNALKTFELEFFIQVFRTGKKLETNSEIKSLFWFALMEICYWSHKFCHGLWLVCWVYHVECMYMMKNIMIVLTRMKAIFMTLASFSWQFRWGPPIFIHHECHFKALLNPIKLDKMSGIHQWLNISKCSVKCKKKKNVWI